eukprot:11359043-Heterocapsa_arctica.AAC.1
MLLEISCRKHITSSVPDARLVGGQACVGEQTCACIFSRRHYYVESVFWGSNRIDQLRAIIPATGSQMQSQTCIAMPVSGSDS